MVTNLNVLDHNPSESIGVRHTPQVLWFDGHRFYEYINIYILCNGSCVLKRLLVASLGWEETEPIRNTPHYSIVTYTKVFLQMKPYLLNSGIRNTSFHPVWKALSFNKNVFHKHHISADEFKHKNCLLRLDQLSESIRKLALWSEILMTCLTETNCIKV